ncbi:MAG: hypothetical protein EZS28_047599, partial [Streblomastix strix]
YYYLFRGVLDAHRTSLAAQIESRNKSFGIFAAHVGKAQRYLEGVLSGELPVNQQILSLIQEIFNLIPDLDQPQLKKGMIAQTNDNALVLLQANLVRTMLALDNLIENKIELQRKQEIDALDQEEKRKKKEKEEKDKKDKEEKEKREKEEKEKLGNIGKEDKDDNTKKE